MCSLERVRACVGVGCARLWSGRAAFGALDSRVRGGAALEVGCSLASPMLRTALSSEFARSSPPTCNSPYIDLSRTDGSGPRAFPRAAYGNALPRGLGGEGRVTLGERHTAHAIGVRGCPRSLRSRACVTDSILAGLAKSPCADRRTTHDGRRWLIFLCV